MKFTSTVFIASTEKGYLVECARDTLESRLAELKAHYRMPITVEVEQDLHPSIALRAVEATRNKLAKVRHGDFFRASRDELLDALNASITTIIQRGHYPAEDDEPGAAFVSRFLAPGYVADLTRWLRS